MKKLWPIFAAFLLSLIACSAPNPTPKLEDSFYENIERKFTVADNFDTNFAAEESYLAIEENKEISASESDTITFSLKTDTAAYTNVLRYIKSGNLPPTDAVRTEEMINYFTYETEMSFNDSPFSIYTEVAPSPFDPLKHLAFIRVKTDDIDKSELPNSNLTFLIDSSGSMESYDKLPLLQEAFALLTETLGENDKVSIVTYAGSSEVLLDGVSGSDKDTILNAINSLTASGSTAGANGINTAYVLAAKNYIEGANNRVILATDGDFNVGISDIGDLEDFISERRKTGVYLSILGFGTGNLRDDIMETLSSKGNGNYSYINSVHTAKKVLVDQLASNLFIAAEDVKAQIVFSPDTVKSYRLIGYENRKLDNEDFEDDTKDAGEIGIGTDVVVLFELELTDSSMHDLFDVRIRYKNPGERESMLTNKVVTTTDIAVIGSTDFNFAASVAAYAHLLRDSIYKGQMTADDVINTAMSNLGSDPNGYRREFVDMLYDYARLT